MTQFYFDFCCRSGGNNLNAGTLTANDADGEPSVSPLVTYASGNWVQATGVFTVASGNPISDGVVAGQWASVYPNGTTPDTVFSSQILARDATTVTLNLTTAYHGSAPTNGTGNRTMRVGGAWAGMAGASGFPLTFIRKFTPAVPPRVNLKNDQTYNITANITPTNPGGGLYYATISGYTTVYGDGGKATIDGGTSGASYVLLTLDSTRWLIRDLIFQNNGATGNAGAIGAATAGCTAFRVVVAHIRGSGLVDFSNGYYQCEVYDCNQSNTVGFAGFHVIKCAVNCISHDNTGSNTAGFMQGGFGLRAAACINCIADSNGGNGFVGTTAVNCDAYNNGGDGFLSKAARSVYWENSNAIKNGGYGFNWIAGGLGTYACLRYGAGTMANTSGGINIAATAAVTETEPASAYPTDTHPWADPDTGDFRIVLSEAMGTGRGEFTQEYVGFTDVTTMYPDIGAVWHKAGMRMPKRMEGGF